MVWCTGTGVLWGKSVQKRYWGRVLDSYEDSVVEA